MSFTVWAYDHDAAVHHANDLMGDTLYALEDAVAIARKRVAETNHNTGYANLVDSSRCRMGDRGIVATFKKDKNGRVYATNVRPDIKSQICARARLKVSVA